MAQKRAKKKRAEGKVAKVRNGTSQGVSKLILGEPFKMGTRKSTLPVTKTLGNVESSTPKEEYKIRFKERRIFSRVRRARRGVTIVRVT